MVVVTLNALSGCTQTVDANARVPCGPQYGESMSTSRETTVWCDAEGCVRWSQHSGTKPQVRKEVRSYGWTLRDAKDFCPEHSPQGDGETP